MDKSQQIETKEDSLTESQVITSTPRVRSDMGRKLVKKQFMKNLKDLSVLELERQIQFLHLEEEKTPEAKPFIFMKSEEESEKYEFHSPSSISPETIEKYKKLFDATPELKRKRIRL